MHPLPLFDVNGEYGRGAYREPEFAETRDLLAHMDYLGIERSLVTHTEARDLNPIRGDRRLLAELAADPEAAKRLIPVLAINPATYYEKGGMEFLRNAFERQGARALTFYPYSCRHAVLHVEPVLAELAPFRPVVIWNTRDTNGDGDYRDLAALARRLPGIQFICTRKMWGGFGNVLDAMRRCPNIHTDISWVHMRRTIELLVEHFGAERVFFGTGAKLHYGAAVAALVHADLSPEDRALIAHGNIERLLNLDAADFTIAGGRDDKPLWEACRTGRPLDLEVIDAHGHVGPSNRGWFLPETEIPDQARDTGAFMDRIGINRIIVSAEEALFGECLEGNLFAEKELQPFRDKFSGYAAFNPLYADELVPAFDRLFAGGFFVGFKVLCAYWRVRPEDPRFAPMLAYADRRRLPILYHTWSDSWNSPRLLDPIVRTHPNAVFLLGHSGGCTGRPEAIELARKYDNVYLEFCGSFTGNYPWAKTFEQVGRDRIVFGTDGGGAHNQAWELGHFLSQPIPDADLVPALGENMKNILARSDIPAAARFAEP